MMYSNLPNFVLGFHGCDKAVAERILLHEDKMRSSDNDYDWLGPGIYFWENNPQRAIDYAQICVINPNCIKGYFKPMEAVVGFDIP